MTTLKPIVFLSCVAVKLDKEVQAKDLYISTLFKFSLRYARKITDNDDTRIFILSALHGLVKLDQVIGPYNLTLNTMSESEKQIWAIKIIEQINNTPEIDLKSDQSVVFLAGNNYRKYLISAISGNVYIPMKGLPIGKQLNFLKNNI